MIDFGMTPDAAVRSVRQGTDRLIAAIGKVVLAFDSPSALGKALKKARCPFGITQMAVASAFALTFPRAENESPLILIRDGKAFTEQLTKDPAVEPAAAFLNLGSRMMLVGQLVGRVTALRPIEVATDLIDWSNVQANQDSLS